MWRSRPDGQLLPPMLWLAIIGRMGPIVARSRVIGAIRTAIITDLTCFAHCRPRGRNALPPDPLVDP
jgi:hypothetical protein